MDNKELLLQISEMMEEHTRRIEVKMENEVTRKIESLFDGYKLTHEKQWELERRIEKLEQLVEDLQSRIA